MMVLLSYSDISLFGLPGSLERGYRTSLPVLAIELLDPPDGDVLNSGDILVVLLTFTLCSDDPLDLALIKHDTSVSPPYALPKRAQPTLPDYLVYSVE